jgi:hypothetical protein
MEGILQPIDKYRSEAELKERVQDAWDNAMYLRDLLQRMENLKKEDPMTLWLEWPGMLDTLKCYTYHHQFIKDARPLAKVYGWVTEDSVKRSRRRGRTTRSSYGREGTKSWSTSRALTLGRHPLAVST